LHPARRRPARPRCPRAGLANERRNHQRQAISARIRCNTYTGGTQVGGGTLAAASPTAFGNGDVYVGSGGGIRIAASAPVTIAARYTQLDNTTLELDIDIDGNGGGRLRVGGSFTVAGGTLHVKFVNGYTPKAGDTIALIDGGAGSAQFSTVTVDGFKATPV